MEKSSKLTAVKTVTSFVVARSVSGIIVTAAHALTPTHTKAQKAQVYIGAYVLGAMVADKATTYTDQKIDDLVDGYRKFRKELNQDPK